MRPRVIPAEDLSDPKVLIPAPGEASMRPRVIPAEDAERPRLVFRERLASMRPRVIPAEDFEGSITMPGIAPLQ